MPNVEYTDAFESICQQMPLGIEQLSKEEIEEHSDETSGSNNTTFPDFDGTLPIRIPTREPAM